MCSGRTSESGEFEIPGITDRKPESTAFAPYRIVMDRQTLGSLSLTLGRSNETLTFHRPPRAGDVMPDIDKDVAARISDTLER